MEVKAEYNTCQDPDNGATAKNDSADTPLPETQSADLARTTLNKGGMIRVGPASGFSGRCPMSKGTIRRVITERGFGFIRTAEGTDLFFRSSEVQGVQFVSLREGQEVEFEVRKGRGF